MDTRVWDLSSATTWNTETKVGVLVLLLKYRALHENCYFHSNKYFKCKQHSLFWNLYLQTHIIILIPCSNSTDIQWLLGNRKFQSAVTDHRYFFHEQIPLWIRETSTQKLFSVGAYLMLHLSHTKIIFGVTHISSMQEIKIKLYRKPPSRNSAHSVQWRHAPAWKSVVHLFSTSLSRRHLIFWTK